MPERLGLPQVPDPRDDALVEDDLAERPALIDVPEASDLHVVGEDVRPEPLGAAAVELEDGAVPEDGFLLAPAQHEPGPADAPRAGGDDAPPPVHAQVAADHDVALELEQKILADGARRQQPPSVHERGDGRSARMRRLRRDLIPDQRLNAPRGAVERIALGHSVPHGSLEQGDGAARKRHVPGRMQSASRRCRRTAPLSTK